MSTYLTIGYLQSKIIRTPLHLNKEWNTKVNECSSKHDLMLLCLDEATISEKDSLTSAILIQDEVNVNGRIPVSDEQIPERYQNNTPLNL